MQEKTKLIYNTGKDLKLDDFFKKLHNYIENQVLISFKEKEKQLLESLGTNEVDENNKDYIGLTMSFEYQLKALEKLEESYIFAEKALSHI